MSEFSCIHASRAIGPHFERCLVCNSWRLHFYGMTRVSLTRHWWPAEVPMPCASPDEEDYAEFPNFDGWLEESAA